jgi:hypothetical protein
MEAATRKITAIERTTAAIHAIHPAASNYLGGGAYNVAGAGSFNACHNHLPYKRRKIRMVICSWRSSLIN